MDAAFSFVVFLTGFAAVGCITPEIVGDFLVEVKGLRASGRLNCTTINVDSSSIVVWEHSNAKIVISENSEIMTQNLESDGKLKYEIVHTKNGIKDKFMLVINRLLEEDAGNYTCYIRMLSTPHTSWPRKLQSLLVLVPPSMDSTVTQGTSEIHEGETFTMICGGSGIPAPNITWSKEDGGMLPNGTALYRGTHLKLINITRYMAGIYVCTADNNVAPPALTKSQLLIFSSPITEVVQDTVGQAQNRQYDAKLECIISGYPTPSLRWSRKTNEGIHGITDTEKFVISKMLGTELRTGQVWYSLKVKNVQANDYTDYFCTATNTYGESESTVSLYDSKECQGANCPSFETSSAVLVNPSVFARLIFLAFSIILMFRDYFIN